MIVDNSDQSVTSDQGLEARSVSISQRIPGLCTGAAYVVKWSHRIDIQSSSRKRAPTPTNNCTVAFDLVDQAITVIGGPPPEGAPLPFSQTRSGDIFRYRGSLDYNILTITLNCSAVAAQYYIDNITFVGPAGTCCQSSVSAALVESTEYGFTTLGMP